MNSKTTTQDKRIVLPTPPSPFASRPRPSVSVNPQQQHYHYQPERPHNLPVAYRQSFSNSSPEILQDSSHAYIRSRNGSITSSGQASPIHSPYTIHNQNYARYISQSTAAALKKQQLTEQMYNLQLSSESDIVVPTSRSYGIRSISSPAIHHESRTPSSSSPPQRHAPPVAPRRRSSNDRKQMPDASNLVTEISHAPVPPRSYSVQDPEMMRSRPKFHSRNQDKNHGKLSISVNGSAPRTTSVSAPSTPLRTTISTPWSAKPYLGDLVEHPQYYASSPTLSNLPGSASSLLSSTHDLNSPMPSPACKTLFDVTSTECVIQVQQKDDQGDETNNLKHILVSISHFDTVTDVLKKVSQQVARPELNFEESHGLFETELVFADDEDISLNLSNISKGHSVTQRVHRLLSVDEHPLFIHHNRQFYTKLRKCISLSTPDSAHPSLEYLRDTVSANGRLFQFCVKPLQSNTTDQREDGITWSNYTTEKLYKRLLMMKKEEKRVIQETLDRYARQKRWLARSFMAES